MMNQLFLSQGKRPGWRLMIADLMGLCLIVAGLIIFGPAARLQAQAPPPFHLLTDQEWNAVKSNFQTGFASAVPEKRIKALSLVSDVLYKFSEPDQAIEAFRLVWEKLADEADDRVIENLISFLARMPTTSYGSQTLDWLIKNHEKALPAERTKLYLIKAIARFTYLHDKALALLAELNMDSDPKTRLAVADALRDMAVQKGQKNNEKIMQKLLDLILDKDLQVVTAVLNSLARLKDYDTINPLIQQLGNETRMEVRNKIAETLQAITGQTYGPKTADWQKWWLGKQKEKVSPLEIRQALGRANVFLSKQSGLNNNNDYYIELTTYALMHAGLPLNDPAMREALGILESKPLSRTYNVALMAMVLAEVDKVKYQNRLAQCAQWLLGNESRDGNWQYGIPVKDLTQTVTSPSPDTKSNNDARATRSLRKIKIKAPPRRAEGTFDNSNTQYALLGLKACAEAGIEIPMAAWADAEKHLRQTQCADGSWSYGGKTQHGYGSMTAGGLAGLIICLVYQERGYKNDPAVIAALDWLDKHFVVKENAEYGSNWHYYYLYALERAGIIYGTESFGNHEWYQLGAKYLLHQQSENGSWNSTTLDTCFAILFLSRATQTFKLIETK